MRGLHGAKGNRAKREYVPEIDIDAREGRAGDGGDGGRGVGESAGTSFLVARSCPESPNGASPVSDPLDELVNKRDCDVPAVSKHAHTHHHYDGLALLQKRSDNGAATRPTETARLVDGFPSRDGPEAGVSWYGQPQPSGTSTWLCCK